MAAIHRALIFLLYLLLRVLGFPLLVLYFLWRGARNRQYFWRFAERLGFLPRSFQLSPPGGIWLHAVSVGEAVSAAGLMKELRAAMPGIPLFLSVSTLAGRTAAERQAAALADGIFFAPIDYAFAVRRALRTLRPAVAVVLETEIWPVLYRETKRAGCRLMIVNGRISDRAFRRYMRARWVFGPVLGLADRILTQSESDRARYLEIGAPAGRLQVFGNLKYDAVSAAAEPPEAVRRLIVQLRPEAVWAAASTVAPVEPGDVDEDDAVIAAFRSLSSRHPGILLILAPRKPERFPAVAAKLSAAGIPFVRRSEIGVAPGITLPGVLLLDSIGELASVFGLAGLVFMGGTLARRGGHNVLEPASQARAIIVGPHMENFSAIASDFRQCGAWLQIAGPDELTRAVEMLIENPVKRGELGARAAELVRQNAGVGRRAAQEILFQQDRAIPVHRRGPWPLLGILAHIWEIGSRWKQARDVANSRALGRPVISVGGIAMGGTGKTPFTQMLARELRRVGHRPAILTRGYRRASKGKPAVLEAGQPAGIAETGDEGQILLRAGDAHLGVAADRYLVGRLLEQQFSPSIFLLDDGFQHRRLRRNVDIVLIDALDPFGGCGVFPLGRLREPVQALARATVFVITRTQPGRNYEGIRQVLRRVNPDAPVFLASVTPGEWGPRKPPPGPVAAFCGLGNPGAFWRTLRDLGIRPVYTKTYPDHHRYSERELSRLSDTARRQGAVALLTTEKDWVNLPPGLHLEPAVYWLKIGAAVADLAGLLRIAGQTVLVAHRPS